MKFINRRLPILDRAVVLLLAAGLVLAGASAAMAADDLESLLEDVAEEYARAYAAPLLQTFGPDLNSALYSTANIPWSQLTVTVALKVMATHLNEDDQTFRRVIRDVNLSDYGGPNLTGDVVIAGPTVFGDTDVEGTIEGYVSGVQVFSDSGIEGAWKTRFAPLPTPEVSVGGIYGGRATLRYFPEMDVGDIGKVKFVGYGLQWSPNGLVPTLPVDVMIGFFKQDLDIGDVVAADASSVFVAAGKSFTALTVYGGLASESSDMTITYTYIDNDEEVVFDVEGQQDFRATLGATLDFVAKLNLEMGVGDVTTYSAGLLFGF